MANPAYQKLKDTNTLPSPTGVALEILRLAGDESATIEAITAVVESDPGLSGRLLKLVNSAFGGLPRRIAAVSAAVRLLGIRTVKNMALGLSLVSSNRNGQCKAFDYETFWSESLARAVAARQITIRLRNFPPDEAFTTGLLGRIGLLALATAQPREYSAVLESVGGGESPDLAGKERDAFGIDHNELSAAMMADWRLHELFCEAVRFQDTPDQISPEVSRRAGELARTLHLAGVVASLILRPQPGCEPVQSLLKEMADLGVAGEDTHELFDTIAGEWREAGAIFSVSTRDVPPLEQLRAKARTAATRAHRDGTPANSQPASVGGEADPLRILIVDDDPSALSLLEKHLTTTGYRVLTAANGVEALEIDHVRAPQMIITDWDMPEMSGLDLCRRLRGHEGAGFVYVIMVTANAEKNRVVEALESGADDFLTKPYSRQELLARVRAGERIVRLDANLAERSREIAHFNAQLTAVNDQLRIMATSDELTGLPNRREAMSRLAEHWAIAVRHDDPVSCMVLDIDHFKLVNDTYGHATGDAVLKATADALRRTARYGEAVSRVGGEEFLVVCPRSKVAAVQVAAERMLAAVAANIISCDGVDVSVTISAGIAERTDSMRHPDELLKAADDALYAAKRSGRNRVWVAGQSAAPGPDEAAATGVPSACAVAAPVVNEESTRLSGNSELVRSNEIRREQARALRMLLEFSCGLIGAGSLDRILERSVAAAAELMRSRRVSIMLPDPKGAYLTIARSVGMDEEAAVAVRVPVGESIAGQVFASGETVVVNSRQEADRESKRYDSSFFVSAPLVSKAMRAADRTVGVLNITERHDGRPFEPGELDSVNLLCNITAAAISDLTSRHARDRASDSVVVALATLAECRDVHTGRHLDRVTRYALMLAEALRTEARFAPIIDDEFLQSLPCAMTLHDIGKVGIPDRILLKPGELTLSEFATMKRHTALGAKAIQSIMERGNDAGFLRMAHQIALSHHEKYDGSGYPQGLAGDRIPLPARIAALADVYDAVTSRRPYKYALSTERAGGIVREGSGSHFDPAVVAAFLQLESKFAAVATELSDAHGAAASTPLPVRKPVLSGTSQ